MTIKYLDPYKEDLYGKLRGDKAEAYFKASFDEAKIHQTDNAYILAGFVTAYSGVVRSYKAEQALTPGLCAIPIYGSEYEIRQKDVSGQWIAVKYQPSVYEKALYETIKTHEGIWIPDGKAISGEIAFVPNGMCGGMDEVALQGLVAQNNKISITDLTGKLPSYTPPSDNNQRKNGAGWKGIGLEDKLAFIKKELVDSIAANGFTVENSLGCLTDQMLLEHTDENFQQIYFDMLMAVVR
jgi:hypothetical protein